MRPNAILAVLFASAVTMAKAPVPPPPGEAAIPGLAAALAEKLAGRTLKSPAGADVKVETILNAQRAETCLRTIGSGGGWPASWLIVQDTSQEYDLVLRVAQNASGGLADPDPLFLAARREWDDKALDEAVRAATGAKPPREKTMNVVVQGFSTRVETTYVYDLPKTGSAAKGLLALLPEGSLLRESQSLDLGDGRHHTLAIVLERPRFVPADCSTADGRKAGHRDQGGIVLVLAGEAALEDRLDITARVKQASLPRFACAPGDEAPGAIDRLVDTKFMGREPVRLLDLRGKLAKGPLAGTHLTVGVKKEGGVFKLFAE